MEIVFLDNGLISRGEHSYSLVRAVGAALACRGLAYRVFGPRCIDPSIIAELGVIPHFSRSLYDNERPLLELPSWARSWSSERATSERRSARLLNAAFARDLAALPRGTWGPDKLWVFPGLSQNQIAGLVASLVAAPQTARPRVVCQLMFPPEWTSWGRIATRGETLYRDAFRKAGRLVGECLYFTAENAAIASLYRDRFGIAAATLPVPFGGTRPARLRAGVPSFGFLGYSKSDKGFRLLPQAIALCRARGLAAGFTIQIRHDGWEAATVAAEAAMRRIDGVRFIEGVLDAEGFAAETDRIDAMLLPYHPRLFGLRGSGLFTQSVAAGRPVVASAGTFAAAEIARGAAEGEVFAPYDAAAFAEAILRLSARLPAACGRAATLAKDFAGRHSAAAYVDILLAHAPTELARAAGRNQPGSSG
jgi:glycosyltransferase involved in cell wall biosynthesis